MVLFGGVQGGNARGDAWELPDGATAWSQVVVNGPEPLEEHAIAYDSLRGQGVMFGGRTATIVKNTTWIWDGGGVNGPPVVTKPDPRWGHAMAFDELRGRTVMFGGLNQAGNALQDTWEWDGTDWTRRTPLTSPVARTDHVMAYDPTLRMVVLFGGGDISGSGNPLFRDDLWAWDGTDWLLLDDGTGASTPIPRKDAILARDPLTGGVVLFAGRTFGLFLNDTWVRAGSQWLERHPATVPRQRIGHSAAYVSTSGKTVVLGGTLANPTNQLGTSSEVWEWDGNDWSARITQHTPLGLNGAVFAYDESRDRIVMFGLQNSCTAAPDLWEWDGTTWLDRTVSGPPALVGEAMVYDASRGATLISGGTTPWCGPGTPVADVWAWDGAVLRQLPEMPAPRTDHAMCYDSDRQRIVVFGGYDAGPQNQTWEALGDPLVWIVRSPTTTPPSGGIVSMAYDESRHRTTLVRYGQGGFQHWEWDGNDWIRMMSATAPFFGWLAYDRSRGRLVLLEEENAPAAWEWVGSDWLQRTPPQRDVIGKLVFDTGRSRIVAANGSGDVWYYGASNPATYATFGTGCAGSAGIPELRGAQLPWVGCPFSLEFDNLPAQPGIVWIGFDKSDWNGLPLPFDLSQIGITGCLLYTGIVHSFPIANNAWSFNIPNLASLLGGVFYNQALILDPGTNPFGAVVTNGGEAVIGGK